MDKKIEMNFLELPALKISQPLGTFFAVGIAAKDLLDISFTEPMRYVDSAGNVKGSQRVKDDKRLKEIAKYIDSVEMAFPNSIILAANYGMDGVISKDEAERWKILEDKEKSTYTLVIPKKIQLAAIIDGQHRLKAFDFVENNERFNDLQLLCSIYFDLPNSYQAFLFATINSNQKKVDRSLALDQFGYNVNDEPEKAWTPEKFAVFLSRKLNIDQLNSPFYKHIKVAPLDSDILFSETGEVKWTVSTATIVDGICSLISSNPKRDRVLMQQSSVFSGRNRSMVKDIKDISPLRTFFIEGKDQTIYDVIINYFKCFEQLFWQKAVKQSYIIKTVGIQASFDILKAILTKENSDNPQLIDFKKYLIPASNIDFSDRFFQASGIGRSRIRKIIGVASDLISKTKIKKNDLGTYETILNGVVTNTPKEKMMWEEDAETAVINALESAQWNYDNKTVSLYSNHDYDTIETISTYESFLSKLELIADIAFVTSLPSDSEFAGLQRENFDIEDLVLSCLIEYETNLKKLNWI